MIEKPMDVLSQFPVRKSKKQKQAFRDEIQSYAQKLGYEVAVEKGSGAHNIVIGDPVNAKYLITAHYDTPAGMPFPNLITPCSFWPFLGYQLFITLLIFGAALVPGMIAVLCGLNVEAAAYIWYLFFWIFLLLMMYGPANKNNANDNTSGVVTVLETAANLPQGLRGRVCFVLFDLEEAGLVGSAFYRKIHKKETENQIVLNLDCVGDGNELMMFPNKKLKKDAAKMEWLHTACGISGEKSMALREKGFSYYPSDQKNFPYGVGIAAFNRSSWAGLYCDKIHTNKDTVLEVENVIFLRNCLIRMVSSSAVQV